MVIFTRTEEIDMPKIQLEKLKQIVREEVEAFKQPQQVDKKEKQLSVAKNAAQEADVVSKMSKGAGSMLNAIANFEKIESEALKSSIGDKIEDIKKILIQVVQNPYNYVDKVNPVAASNAATQLAKPSDKKVVKPQIKNV